MASPPDARTLSALLLLTLTLLALCLSGAARAEDEPNGLRAGVPNQDIIFGEIDAPHELLVYLSPGCSHCLDHVGKVASRIERDYVGTGRLRMTIRLVPQLFLQPRDKSRASVMAENSTTMADNLMCRFAHEGAPALFDLLKEVAGQFRTRVAGDERAFRSWPYMEQAAISEFYNDLARTGALRFDQVNVCQQPHVKERFNNFYRRNLALLSMRYGKNVTVPVYYLDDTLLGGPGNGDPRDFLLPKLDAALR